MDHALVWSDPAVAAGPGTHVLLIGVGKYTYGKGPKASPVGGDLTQLTSPPLSARAMADWFIRHFNHASKPLASVAMLVSEPKRKPYTPPRAGALPVTPPAATLAHVRAATTRWATRLSSNRDNMAVFYFCGHGISKGQRAALLLDDFGLPDAEFDGAIDLEILYSTMKNSPAIQQLYLLDCCRTDADNLYENEARIGSRTVSVPSLERSHSDSPQ